MKNILLQLYEAGQLPHALLLITSTPDTLELASKFIKTLSLSPADYLIYRGEEVLKIAEARAIRQFASRRPYQGPIKLIVIADASALTVEAANALLKTLEEPPESTHLVLATTRPESLLPTIRSRCQTLTLKKAIGPIPTTDPLIHRSLIDSFAYSALLAKQEVPLTTYFNDWLAQLEQEPMTVEAARKQRLIVKYLALSQTNANRRLLLDNFFLELYNMNHERNKKL